MGESVCMVACGNGIVAGGRMMACMHSTGHRFLCSCGLAGCAVSRLGCATCAHSSTGCAGSPGGCGYAAAAVQRARGAFYSFRRLRQALRYRLRACGSMSTRVWEVGSCGDVAEHQRASRLPCLRPAGRLPLLPSICVNRGRVPTLSYPAMRNCPIQSKSTIGHGQKSVARRRTQCGATWVGGGWLANWRIGGALRAGVV
jgi:hypothetical protein